MSEYDCVGVTSEYLESLKNKIDELEQQNKELGENEQHYKKVYLEELALKSKVEQQKAELREFILSKLSEAWSKMGDTGSSDYMSKLNDENYWFGYFSALENAQDIIDKYKQQEERDEV